MLDIAIKDTRSVTGKNMRNILLLTDKVRVNDITPDDITGIKYRDVPEDESWRIGFLKERIEVKHGDFQVNGFSFDAIEFIINDICIN